MTEVLLKPTPGPFFRFADETSWVAAAKAAGFYVTITEEDGTETEQLEAYNDTHAIDVVGIIKKGGEWDEDGTETVAPTPLDGFHINYVGDLPNGWEAFEVKPEQPYRVFA